MSQGIQWPSEVGKGKETFLNPPEKNVALGNA